MDLPKGELNYIKHTLFNETWVASCRGESQQAKGLLKVVYGCRLLTEYFQWVRKIHGDEKADALEETYQDVTAILLRRA